MYMIYIFLFIFTFLHLFYILSNRYFRKNIIFEKKFVSWLESPQAMHNIKYAYFNF